MARYDSPNRRGFLKTSAGLSASVIAVPYFVPSTAFGANERVVTGHIGVRNQGLGNLKAMMNNAGAVCDVDQEVLGKASKAVEQSGRTCATFSDYRKLLERKDIDAVVITTPDHWHALMTIHACQAGKDVYCEKPLTLAISEGRKMVQAARDHNRIVQTGSQQRSDGKFRKTCEYVRAGLVGKLHTILVGIPAPNHPGEPVPDANPPSELDYDMWLGPAPERPYNVKRIHYNFRFFWDYSGGQMTNFGAHNIDIAHWGMDADKSGPLSIDGEATFHPKKWHEVTESCRIKYLYPNDVTMIVGQVQKDIPEGTTFIGDQGKIHVNRQQITADPPQIIEGLSPTNISQLYVSSNHHQNFLDCIKSRELPICDVEIGHRTATACHLGNIAVRIGRKIQWDAAKEQIVGDETANQMVTRSYRSPWQL